MQHKNQGLLIAFILAFSPLAFAGNSAAPAKSTQSPTWNQVLRAWMAGVQKTTHAAVKKPCSTLTDCEYALTYGSNLDKAYAAGVLSTMGSSAVPTLTKTLTDENEHIRSMSAASLKEIGPDAKDATPALIKSLGDDSTNFRIVQDALGSIGKATIPSLIALFPEPKGDSETEDAKRLRWRIRNRAVTVFGTIGGVAVPDLIEILKSEKDDMSQDFAAEALGNIGPAAKDAVPALIQHITESNRYKKKATEKLGQYQWTLKSVLETLRDSDILWGARALGKIGPDAKDAAPKLLSLLQAIQNEEFNANKHVLIEALGGIGPTASASVPTLIQLLKDPGADVRLATIVALGKMGPSAKEAKANLEAIIKFAESVELKNAAQTALRKIGGQS